MQGRSPRAPWSYPTDRGRWMCPGQSVVVIPRHAPSEELRRILLENTHSRMPVYDEKRVDNIVGYISVKDLLSLAWSTPSFWRT